VYAHGGVRPIILASSSPRRRELLALSGLDFQVRPAAAVETAHPGEGPEEFVQRMSRTKAGLGAATVAAAGAGAEVVIGADTIVVLDETPGQPSILGKPRDAREAAEMLCRLRGRTHRVLSSVSVVDTASQVELDDVVTARVPMRNYSDEEIGAYVATGNPLDKAGAYAIQFAGFKPVDHEHFSDCFATVMGLPVCTLLGLLEQTGIEAPLAWPAADCQRFDPAACPIYPLIDQGGHAE
jgi:MAF protein